MRIDTVRATDLLKASRLDSAYHLSSGKEAAATLSRAQAEGLPFKKLGPPDGIARIWKPNRFKRAYAAPREEALPYLRPYDVFEYLPVPADMLSVRRNRGIATYRLKTGMILQSCSGRNLGPAIIVDRYLEQFLVGDDMMRIEIGDEKVRFYVLAFLKTSLAQALLRQGKTGSVIDHISEEHVAGLHIPIIRDVSFSKVADSMGEAVALRERARTTLTKIQQQYEALLPKIERKQSFQKGWTVRAKKLTGRLDAASYDPLVSTVRNALLRAGGRTVREVATVLKPPGRYKTVYVSADFGSPILSGTQLLQDTTINLQYLASRSLKNRENYELKAGWIAYQADGRAEETLGLPVVITPDRHGWLASGHVGRIVPNKDTELGWLYAGLRTPHAQLQIKALASGSVVDATFPADMESVVVPPSDVPSGIEWNQVRDSWELFARAAELEKKSIQMLERELTTTDLRLA